MPLGLFQTTYGGGDLIQAYLPETLSNGNFGIGAESLDFYSIKGAGTNSSNYAAKDILRCLGVE